MIFLPRHTLPQPTRRERCWMPLYVDGERIKGRFRFDSARFYQRSKYTPHQGAKEMARRRNPRSAAYRGAQSMALIAMYRFWGN